jgi:hypothetical protein
MRTHRPFKKAINVAALIGASEQIVQLPQINVSIVISAKTLVFVKIPHNGGHLLISKKNCWNVSF